MTDPTIGPLRPSDPTSTMAKAAAKLDGIATAWPDEAMVERVRDAIADVIYGHDFHKSGPQLREVATEAARAAIAAIDAPPGT